MLLKVDKESAERDDDISPAGGSTSEKEDSGRMTRILKTMKRAKRRGEQDNAATATTATPATATTRTATRRPRALVTTAYSWFPPFRLPLVS